MKKSLFVLVFSLLFTIASFAQSTKQPSTVIIDESKKSTLSYSNVPVLKILEGKDAYVVIYQKYKYGAGSVVIPKKWARGNPESPRKLKFRPTQPAVGSYLTIVKKDGEFSKVILNTTMNKQDSVWGVVDYHKEIEGSDKDTLEEIEL